MDTENSIFWVHLDIGTVYNLKITTIAQNLDTSLIDDITVYYPSGARDNIMASLSSHEFSNTENDSSIRNNSKRDESVNPDNQNDDNDNDDAVTATMTGTYEVHYGSPDKVKRSWWGCDDNIFTYTCSGIPTTQVISGITAKMYYTTCDMPSYMLGHYGGALNIQIFSINDTTITATLTDWTIGTITCTHPTTLVDPTGSTVTAVCTDLPSEIDYKVNYVRDVVITSCDFPVGVSATFLETSSLTRIDWDYTTYMTDTNVPTFSPVISTFSASDPAGNLGEVTCVIQLDTFSNSVSTTSIPTTSCVIPTNLSGKIKSSISTLTLPNYEVLPTTTVMLSDDTFTYTNLNILDFSSANVPLLVTDPQDVTTTANCVVTFTNTVVGVSTLSFPESSCTMPTDFDGKFSSSLSSTIVSVDSITATITVTNINFPIFSPAIKSLIVTDPTGKVGTATCEVNNLQTNINNSPFVFHTTTCAMPTSLNGIFVEHTQETVVSNKGNKYTITLINQNIPQYDTVETTVILTNPTGELQPIICDIDITFFETIGTTVGVPVTTCLDPEAGILEFQIVTSLTTVSFDDQYATITVTNKALPKFKPVHLTRTLTDPTGLSKEATCDINFAYIDVVTTSCAMPTDIKGKFSPSISSTTITKFGATSVLTFTNYVDPYFDEINQMMFVVDLTGSTCTATCDIGMSTLPLVQTSFLIPTTSCEMPSSINAKFVEKQYTSVITQEGLQTTLTVVNLNVATFSPVTSLLTINDLADKTVVATCAIDFTSATIQDSTVSIPTTSCKMSSGIAASFFVVTRTTEITVNDIVTTLTVTDIAVPTYFAVEKSINIVNPQGDSTEVTCTVSFTQISISSDTVDLKTTSCSMPPNFGGEFVDALSTTIVTISDMPVTVTVTNINEASFAPAKITKTIIDPTGATLEANCVAQFSKILVSTSTFSVLTTSCAMPTDVRGTFEAHLKSTDLFIGDLTTSATITNIDSPFFSPILTTILLTNSAGTTGDATCAIDFTSATVADVTVSIPTTSCELGTDLTGKFITSVSTTVTIEGNITTTLEIINTNKPSFLPEKAYVTPVTNEDGDSIDATCAIGLTSFTVPGTTLAIPTTSCEIPEDIIGTYEYVYSTTIFSTGSFTTTLVITNSILATKWTRAFKTITSTTTMANDVCAFETTTITNPPFRGTVVKVVAVATPPANCPVTTRTVQNSVCSITTVTTATVALGSTETVYEELVLTPAGTCNILYTTVKGTDCNLHKRTSNIVTYFGSSPVNATLIVVETPAGSTCLSSSRIFPSVTISSTTLSNSSFVLSDTKSSLTGSFQSSATATSTNSFVKATKTNDTTSTAIVGPVSGIETPSPTVSEDRTFTGRRTKTLTVTCTKNVCTHVPLEGSDVTVIETGVDTVIVTVTCSTDSEGSVITFTNGHTVAETDYLEPTVTHSFTSRSHTEKLSTTDKPSHTTTISFGFEGSAPNLYKRSSTGIVILLGILAVLF